MAEMDIGEIMKYLPHRYPMLLIDRVVEMKLGESLVAIKNVSFNESYFQGHFPNRPVMPAVIILEAMAQAAGILGFRSKNKTPEDGSIYYLAGTDELRFRRPCVPGDRVMLRATLLSQRRGIAKFAVSSDVDGQLAASATILCADR